MSPCCYAVILALVAQTHRELPYDDLKNAPNPVPIQRIDAWQTGAYCGANCLYLMLQLHGIGTSPKAVRRAVPTVEKGASLLEIKDAAIESGLPVEVLQIRPAQLPDQPMPFIALMGEADPGSATSGHYVVVLDVKVEKEYLKAIDGTTLDLLDVDAGPFNREFSGYVLVASGAPRASGSGRALKWLCAVEAVVLVGLVCAWTVVRFRRCPAPEGER